MSIDYWNYNGSTTGTVSPFILPHGAGSTATSSLWYPVQIVETRTLLIVAPDNWKDEQNTLFVELVNIHTKTGWIVQMVIKASHIMITNPDIEVRKMLDFIPLLKKGASREDTIKINEFFEQNPCNL